MEADVYVRGLGHGCLRLSDEYLWENVISSISELKCNLTDQGIQK